MGVEKREEREASKTEPSSRSRTVAPLSLLARSVEPKQKKKKRVAA